MRKLTTLFFLLFLISNVSTAQEVLTLEKCLQIALDNNLQIKRAENNYLIAKSNKIGAIGAFLPSLEANIGYDYFVGTNFDQNAARQVTATTNSSNPNLSSSWTIFNGLSNLNSYRQSQANMKAAKFGIERDKLNTKSSVYSAYLSIILDKENIKISEERVELLESQLTRVEEREKVGVSNMEDVYNFRSQLANEKLSLINLRNTLRSDELTLYQLLMLDLSKSYEVAPFYAEDEVLLSVAPFQDILANTLEFSPTIKAAQYQQDASKFAFKQASGARYPTISAFARYGSNYSSNGATNPEQPFFDPDTGEPGFNFEPNATFFEQLGYNQFEYLGFTMNIPIFSNFSIKNGIQTARLNYRNSEIDAQQAYQTVTNTLQQTYLGLVSAQETFKAAKENMISLEQSYQFAKK
ncbi:MAG: TolC family protein, partial [Bacteroidota bacterium]